MTENLQDPAFDESLDDEMRLIGLAARAIHAAQNASNDEPEWWEAYHLAQVALHAAGVIKTLRDVHDSDRPARPPVGLPSRQRVDEVLGALVAERTPVEEPKAAEDSGKGAGFFGGDVAREWWPGGTDR